MDGTDKDDIALVQQLPLADEPRLSPDRKWVAFHAALQGAPQVFAIRFPPTGERWQLSTEGDGDPTKARSPEALFGLRLEP